MALFPSSYIPTVAATVTRNADNLSFPFPSQPEAISLYVRFVELGMRQLGTLPRLVAIGGSAAPNLVVFTNGTNYYVALLSAGGVESDSTDSSTPTLGQQVELLITLSAAGAPQIASSINSGAIVTAVAGPARPLSQTWNAQTLYVANASGIGNGYAAFRNILVLRGVQSMTTMRRYAGVG